jgi:formylglycine-generating enzyme required for sulfatase activity
VTNGYSQVFAVAKARQKRLYFMLVGGFLALVAFVGLALTLLHGTSIDVTPEEATETSYIKLVSGLGFVIGEKVYSISNSPEITAFADGYRPSNKIILPSEIGKTVQVVLKELPGQLLISTNTANDLTRWYVDEKIVSISSELDAEVDAGEHLVTVNNLYYKQRSLKIIVKRGEKKQLNIDLEPILGSLNITADPMGSVAKVNGEIVGSTPLRLEQAGGRYKVEINNPDYELIYEELEITNKSENVVRNYKLIPKKAFLKVNLSPAGGSLLLNGKKVDSAGRIEIPSKTPITLSYVKDGYFSEIEKLTLSPNEERTISFKLKPEIGSVDVRSNPSASVLVNGKVVGKTPITIKLPAIRHNIKLSKNGYRSVVKSVTPSGKSSRKIDVILLTEMAARLAEAPKEYKNVGGVELKLFSPSKFTMGGARHEAGQRANEFQRIVNLRKPFYAGKFEVTNEQFARYDGKSSGVSGANMPVTSVSWLQAISYSNWLSFKEGLKPFYKIVNGKYSGFDRSSDGYRLLTEAEWEWLARKALRQKQTTFTWGNSRTIPPMSGNIADENARGQVSRYVPNYNDGNEELAPVGSYKSEKSGLSDLTGNVSEWVHDFYSLVPPDSKTVELDPVGSRDGTLHVIKGSNWRSGTTTELRAAFREGMASGRDDLGFRVGRYLYGGGYAKN